MIGGLVGWLVGWLVGGLVGLIQVHGSWLMTGKSLESIAELLMEKFLVVAAGAAGGAAAALQVTTLVPLKFGVSAFNQKYGAVLHKIIQHFAYMTIST